MLFRSWYNPSQMADDLYYCINEHMKEKTKVSKDRFDMEQEVMKCWNVVDDLKVLHEGVLDRDLTRDQISNILLGLGEIYQLRFEVLFDTFETMVSEGKIK